MAGPRGQDAPRGLKSMCWEKLANTPDSDVFCSSRGRVLYMTYNRLQAATWPRGDNGLSNISQNVSRFNKMRSFDPLTQSSHVKTTVPFHHQWRQQDMNEMAMYFQTSAG
ncbi:hypothetical protein Ae201684_017404 [Aphanomyces euteiches]|uniref:Uncharacterized protein n=1 Tax=Aphanomyces euteiches TaxID=100861 RepID=A0A6G0W952_9STRA|nr:hypothetical protein Ae201684_017404 [Aphanomyces euteiches]